MPARTDAVYAFLNALGLPTENLRDFSASVTRDRNGDHVTVTYNLAMDDPLAPGAD